MGLTTVPRSVQPSDASHALTDRPGTRTLAQAKEADPTLAARHWTTPWIGAHVHSERRRPIASFLESRVRFWLRRVPWPGDRLVHPAGSSPVHYPDLACRRGGRGRACS